ncbi:MAG: TyeA family type III secretion system gatekeeper subunit [Candidatus Xiphinematobacter sp.]|nr:MAG: TyeA family type III secretion system gatekeeper subunit [Candidatus Xiphinematobacter sp.]
MEQKTAQPKRIGSQKFLEEDATLGSIYASMDFLLDALAEDLNRSVPSKEPAFLYTLNDRICLVRSLVKELECTKRLLTTIDRDFLGEDSATPLRGTELDRADALLQTLLKMLSRDTPTAEGCHELANQAQVPPSPQAHIYFFTKLYQQVHDFPMRLFRAPEQREDMLHAIQDALDNAVILEG